MDTVAVAGTLSGIGLCGRAAGVACGVLSTLSLVVAPRVSPSLPVMNGLKFTLKSEPDYTMVEMRQDSRWLLANVALSSDTRRAYLKNAKDKISRWCEQTLGEPAANRNALRDYRGEPCVWRWCIVHEAYYGYTTLYIKHESDLSMFLLKFG
jgi:hypothetical protein